MNNFLTWLFVVITVPGLYSLTVLLLSSVSGENFVDAISSDASCGFICLLVVSATGYAIATAIIECGEE